jgi:hypothetical protein
LGGGAVLNPVPSVRGALYHPSPNPSGGIAAGSFPYGSGAAASRFEAGWTDQNGFLLRSSDNQFFMRVTGQIQADYRGYDIQHDSTDIDSFLVRLALEIALTSAETVRHSCQRHDPPGSYNRRSLTARERRPLPGDVLMARPGW